MAFTVTNVNGYTTPIGNRALSVKKISWLTGDQYVQGTGFKIGVQTFGLRGIDSAQGQISAGGTIICECQVKSVGANALFVRMYNATTGAELSTGSIGVTDSAAIAVIGG